MNICVIEVVETIVQVMPVPKSRLQNHSDKDVADQDLSSLIIHNLKCDFINNHQQ